MTFSDDFNMVDSGQYEEATPAYPVVFGITFTPQISGIALGVVGLLGATYMVLNLLMPAWENFGQQQAKQNDLQGQINQKKLSIQQISQVKQQLEQAKQQQTEVLSLFANEKTLDTLMLDLNRLVVSANTQVSPYGVVAKLEKFDPADQKSTVITDSSFGPQVNGKLKSKTVNIQIVGTYEQTQSIIRNIERLQPLLIIKDYQAALAPPPPVQANKAPSQVGPPGITTSFKLQALMPLSPEELAALVKKPDGKK